MDQPSIFVSYAWKAEKERKVVDSLEKAFKENGIRLNRDLHLGYKDSIKKFMDTLAQADCIVVVLSEAYLESENCMCELLAIHDNGAFHHRVFPVVLRDTRIYDPEDRLSFVEFWEEKISRLEKKLSTVGQTYTKRTRESLDLYADIRRGIDELMDILADMNSLTEDFHVETQFDTLLEKIREQIDDRANSEKFRQKVRSILVQEIDRPVCRDLKYELITECGSDSVVETLERNCQQVNGGLERAIDWLHRATETTLRSMMDKNVGEQDRQRVWEAAQTILGWLVLLSVNDHWFDENKKLFQASDKNIRIDIPARTHVAIEIILSRSNEKPAMFISNPTGSMVYGGRAVNKIIPESGWSHATGSDQIKLTLWNYLYRETRSDPLDAQETQKLKTLLKTRSRREGDYYFTINSSDPQSPLNNDRIQQQLRKDLPELKLVGIRLEGENPVLLASEIDLEVLISEFLNLGKKRP